MCFSVRRAACSVSPALTACSMATWSSTSCRRVPGQSATANPELATALAYLATPMGTFVVPADVRDEDAVNGALDVAAELGEGAAGLLVLLPVAPVVLGALVSPLLRGAAGLAGRLSLLAAANTKRAREAAFGKTAPRYADRGRRLIP